MTSNIIRATARPRNSHSSFIDMKVPVFDPPKASFGSDDRDRSSGCPVSLVSPFCG